MARPCGLVRVEGLEAPQSKEESLIHLDLKTRNPHSDGLNAMRDAGLIPGHLSMTEDRDQEIFNDPNGVMIKLDHRQVKKMITHKNDPMTIVLDGKKVGHAVLQDWQRDPVTHKPVHFNLKHMNKSQLSNETMTRAVPIILGERPEHIKQNEMVQPQVKEVVLEGPISKLPNHLEISLDHLKMDTPIHGKDLKLPKGVALHEEEMDKVMVVLGTTIKAEELESDTTTGEIKEEVLSN